jgi:hypothetical protein
MATCLLSYYGLLMCIHPYFACLGFVMDIIAQIHACMLKYMLVCLVQVAGAAWRAAMRIVAGVGDLVQRIGDSRTGRVLGGRAVEGSGGTMCSLHLAHGDKERRFLG